MQANQNEFLVVMTDSAGSIALNRARLDAGLCSDCKPADLR